MNRHSFKQLHSFLLLWGSQTVSRPGTAMTDYTACGSPGSLRYAGCVCAAETGLQETGPDRSGNFTET